MNAMNDTEDMNAMNDTEDMNDMNRLNDTDDIAPHDARNAGGRTWMRP